MFIYIVMSYDSKWTPNKSLWSDCIFLWLTSQSDLLPRFPPCELLHCPVSVTMTFYLNSSCVSAWWWLSSPPLHVWTSATLTTCCQLAQLHKLNEFHVSSFAPKIPHHQWLQVQILMLRVEDEFDVFRIFFSSRTLRVGIVPAMWLIYLSNQQKKYEGR